MSRDAAVAQLVQAVADWRDVFGRPDVDFERRRALAEEVMNAYDRLVAIPLEMPTAARTNRLAPLTAQQAGAWMRGERAASAAGRIIRHMALNLGRGYTVDRLEQILGGKHQTISARVNELTKAGWLYTFGTARTSSGRRADVYYLTSAAKDLLRAERDQERSDG